MKRIRYAHKRRLHDSFTISRRSSRFNDFSFDYNDDLEGEYYRKMNRGCSYMIGDGIRKFFYDLL